MLPRVPEIIFFNPGARNCRILAPKVILVHCFLKDATRKKAWCINPLDELSE